MKIGDDLVKVDGDEVARVIHLLAELMEKNNVDGLVGIIAMRSLAVIALLSESLRVRGNMIVQRIARIAELDDTIKRINVREKELEHLLNSLLNKVNKVTAPHRHGNPIPPDDLTELANRQVEIEEVLRRCEEDKPTHITRRNVLADIMKPEELADSLEQNVSELHKANHEIYALRMEKTKLLEALEVVTLIEEVLRNQNSTLDDIHQYTNQIDEACDVYRESK
jgi:RNA processing factor Prp31